MRNLVPFFLVVVFWGAFDSIGCRNGGSDGDGDADGDTDIDGDTDTDVDGDADADSDVDPGGPTIISLGTSAPSISEGESVTFTATVTHPDGPEAIAGGSLTTPDGSATYGPFVLAGGSTYSIEITWDQIHRIEPIEFTSDQIRSFRTEFFDTTARRGMYSVDLTLSCGDFAACDGVCVDLINNDENCGECRLECVRRGAASEFGGCETGECLPTWSDCYVYSAFENCEDVCSEEGKVCAEDGCRGYTIYAFGGITDTRCIEYNLTGNRSMSCDSRIPFDGGYIRCCCTSSL